MSQPDNTYAAYLRTNFSGRGNAGLQVGQNEGSLAASVNNRGTINNYFDREGREGNSATQYIQSLSREYRREKDVNPPRTAQTCEWLLRDRRFHTWHRATGAQLLHIVAGPGCGKSVLAKALVDESLAKNSETRATLYYFFKYGQGNQDQVSSALASMLHQLYTQIPDGKLTSIALPKFQVHGQSLSHMWNELWDILISSAEYLEGHTLCVIDALDECREEERDLFISAISRLYSGAESNSNCKIKILITSRPYPGIGFQYEFQGERTNVIHFDADEKSSEVAEEINRVIEDRIPTLIPQVGKDVQETVIHYLQSMDNRTYLWLHLIFDHIRRNIFGQGTNKGLRKLISELPQSVNTAYDTMLHRSPNPRLTKSLLTIVIYARRPMSVTEVKIALELSQESSTGEMYSDSLELETDEQFRQTLKALCGLILMIRDSHVYTLHETVREFLQSGADSVKSTHQWKGCLDSLDGQALLSQSCMSYLYLRDFESLPAWVNNQWQKYIIPDYISYIKRYGLFNYAAEYWCDHYRKSRNEFQEAQSQLAEMLIQKAVLGSHPWIFEFEVRWAMEVSFRSSILALSSYCGMDSLTSTIMGHRSGSFEGTESPAGKYYGENYQSINYGHALAAAAAQGHETTINLLFSACSNNQMLTLNDQERALKVALREGHATAAGIILDHLVSVQPTYSLNGDILLVARISGDINAIQALLNHPSGAKIRLTLPTEICAAARTGDLDILKALLESATQLNIDVPQEQYSNALIEAVRDSHLDSIGLILDYAMAKHPDYEIAKSIFETALWFASPETLLFLLCLPVKFDVQWMEEFFEIAIKNDDLWKVKVLLHFQTHELEDWENKYGPLMALAVLCQHFEIFEIFYQLTPEGIETSGYQDTLERMLQEQTTMARYAIKRAFDHETTDMSIIPPRIRAEALQWPTTWMLSY